MPIGDNIDPGTLDAATMANMPGADMGSCYIRRYSLRIPADAMGEV